MNYNPVIKAFMVMVSPSLTLPYMERSKEIDGVILYASIYKCTKSKDRYYAQVTLIRNGEYDFNIGATWSGFYTSEDVLKRDLGAELLAEISKRILFRRRLLTFISNNPKLPSLLSASFNQHLIIYYKKKGALETAKLHNGRLLIGLPPAEQVYLTDLLAEFQIKVERPREDLMLDDKEFRAGKIIY